MNQLIPPRVTFDTFKWFEHLYKNVPFLDESQSDNNSANDDLTLPIGLGLDAEESMWLQSHSDNNLTDNNSTMLINTALDAPEGMSYESQSDNNTTDENSTLELQSDHNSILRYASIVPPELYKLRFDNFITKHVFKELSDKKGSNKLDKNKYGTGHMKLQV